MGLHDGLKRANTETYQSLVAAVLGLSASDVAEPILEPSQAHLAKAARLCADAGFTGPIVGINTGAGGRWERKRWPRAHQRELISSLSQASVGVLFARCPRTH